MAFKASKKRERKIDKVIRGRPLIPSAAIEKWYAGQIKEMLTEMGADYRSEIMGLMSLKGTKEHYAADAKLPINRFKAAFMKLAKRWQSKIAKLVEKTPKSFVMQVDKHSFSSVGASLKSLGIKQPKDLAKSDWESSMELAVQQNVALIKSIGQEFHDKIEKSVWNSLTSPKGTEQGAYGLGKYLTETLGASKERADFIALDQTKKVFCELNNARMNQNGVDEFEWAHSSAGKTPRHTHMDMDGQTFSTKGPGSELYYPDGTRVSLPKKDDGKPGHAIGCKCRMIPVINISDDD